MNNEDYRSRHVDDELRGVRVASFQIHQRLAKGGSCDVYLAKHLKKDLWIAVKSIRRDRRDDKRLIKQLEREYAIYQSLKIVVYRAFLNSVQSKVVCRL